MDKKSKITIIISIIGLALVLITVTYAYFAANITGIESASTISLNAGTMNIAYSEGDGAITANNMFPREEAWVTKTFTLTGNNTTNQQMKYDLRLNVTSNTFPDDYLTYDLTLVSSTSGTPIVDKTNIPINGTGNKKIGTGIFTNADDDTHNYEFKIYFKDNGLDQSDALGAVFNAKIVLTEGLDEPDGWSNPTAGSLLAGIKSNNRSLSTMGTIPGKEPSSKGSITRSMAEECGGSDCELVYYSNLDDVWNSSNEGIAYYSNIYNIIVGKWVGFADGAQYVTEANASSVTFNNNARGIAAETNLLLGTEDDYGTSYYYRGAVDNNYVVFASMCWRIVRVDGAGNTKLVLYNYNPNNVQNPCAASEDGTTNAFARYNNKYQSAFNTNNNKNTYVGFMYSNNPDSNDFDTAHANDNDSTILTFLKNWYDEKLRTYNDMLADVIWCNDKSIVTDTTYDPVLYSDILGTGLNNDSTYYGAGYRLVPASNSSLSLVCPSAGSDGKLSKFTARDSVNGNAKLYSNNKEYKIGLLTADEVAFAGAAAGASVNYYLSKNASNTFAWSLSPYIFDSRCNILTFSSNGISSKYSARSVSSSLGGVRPAVSLKSDVTISGGSGTQTSPFVIAS